MTRGRRFQVDPAGCGADMTIGSGEYTMSGVECGETRWRGLQICDECRSDVDALNAFLLLHAVTEVVQTSEVQGQLDAASLRIADLEAALAEERKKNDQLMSIADVAFQRLEEQAPPVEQEVSIYELHTVEDGQPMLRQFVNGEEWTS